MPTRRQFIKTGLTGGILLATAFVLHKPLARFAKGALVEHHPFDASARLVMMAVAPVMLAGVIPVAGAERQAAILRATDGVLMAVAGLSAAAQRELAELFALLALSPTRIAVAGVLSPWPQASEEQIRSFLDSWRDSSVDLLQSGYLALHDLIFGAWYADPASWATIGYPGPPKVAHA